MHFYRIALFSSIGLTASVLAACSGGSNSGVPGPHSSSSATPILVAGTIERYTGSDVTTHVYQSPTPTQQNYTAGYTFAQTNTVSTAATGAPAPFDLNVAVTYTTTQVPTAGTQRTSSTTDDYESQSASGSTETVVLVASKSTTLGSDVTGNAAGGGPYVVTTNATTNYTTARTLGNYPLVAGATITEPLARTISQTTTDQNAGGTSPSSNFTTSSAQTYANDGSFTRTNQISNGEQDVFTESSNGSATEAETGPIFALQVAIGVPVSGTSGYTIPVTSTRQNVTAGATPAPSATPGVFNAVDWYPGAALPPSPLSKDVLTVKGATTTLPSGCSGAITEPNVFEVDDTVTTLAVDGSYETQTTQRFDSNGVNVCVLRTTTTNSYSVDTGLPTQVASETYSQVLTSLTAGSASSSRSIVPSH